MEKTRRYLWIGIICWVFVGVFLGTQGTVLGADAKLVKVQPVGEGNLVGFYLDPKVLYVEKDTIVVWLSGVPKEDIQVVFIEGKTCKDVTANPQQFAFDNKGCFVASSITFGETSSLQFVQSGTFSYYVATMEGKIKTTGTIIVRGR